MEEEKIELYLDKNQDEESNKRCRDFYPNSNTKGYASKRKARTQLSEKSESNNHIKKNIRKSKITNLKNNRKEKIKSKKSKHTTKIDKTEDKKRATTPIKQKPPSEIFKVEKIAKKEQKKSKKFKEDDDLNGDEMTIHENLSQRFNNHDMLNEEISFSEFENDDKPRKENLSSLCDILSNDPRFQSTPEAQSEHEEEENVDLTQTQAVTLYLQEDCS